MASDTIEDDRADLRSLVERFESLDEEIAVLNRKKSDVMQEGNSIGFSRQPLRLLLRVRRARRLAGLPDEDMVEVYQKCQGIYEPMIGKTSPRGASEGWEKPSDLPDTPFDDERG